MDISQAKKQVEYTLTTYFTQNEFGHYLLPIESQRPVLLMGPPGIGKTAIMTQIAQEMGVGLVSYSMTHHTRQSALGLPYIVEDEFEGESYRVTHYTMSEIIAAVHEQIRQTGRHEGILFLDEVNCVSETLAPAMLQFLQFKTFGQHSIPKGWVIVCAGNPPEYNNSVREFDIVTWDRLKRVDVEPSYDAWRDYAMQIGVHPAVLSYLEIKKQNFYKVESSAQGRRFTTPRGWVDLSRMIQLYEMHDIAVDVDLSSQYLQDEEISRDFANYYKIFNKYKAGYQVPEILAGAASEEIAERARAAAFDERLSLVSMIIDGCLGKTSHVAEKQAYMSSLLEILMDVRDRKNETSVPELVEQDIERIQEETKVGEQSKTASPLARKVNARSLAFLVDARAQFASCQDPYALLKEMYNAQLEGFKQEADETKDALNNAFSFLEMAFGESQEMLIFVTSLTASKDAAAFISHFGCEKYFEHNKELLFYERQREIIEELSDLDL